MRSQHTLLRTMSTSVSHAWVLDLLQFSLLVITHRIYILDKAVDQLLHLRKPNRKSADTDLEHLDPPISSYSFAKSWGDGKDSALGQCDAEMPAPVIARI